MRLGRAVRTGIEAVRVGGLALRERIETGLVFNPVSPRFRADPYPLYARLRERDPIHRSRPAAGWVLTRYDDVLEVLRDPRFSADDRNFREYPRMRAQRVRDGLAEEGGDDTPLLLRSDPPDHTRLRGLVSEAFTLRAVEKLRPRIEKLVDELLSGWQGRDTVDVMGELAVPLPLTVIAEMLGIPSEDRARFKLWSDALVGFLDPLAAGAPETRQRVDELREYLMRVTEERRRRPADDLLSALVLAEEEGDRLSENELYGTVALLLAAGNETTTNLIGNGTLALLRQPEQLARLHEEPERVPHAVEELLRLDSPVQITGRIPLEPIDFHGHRFEPGQMIVLLLGAANRDPAAFRDPDRLDVARENVRHLSFGHGVHFCLGAQLARLEAEVAFAGLARRFPGLRLAPNTRLQWNRTILLRGLQALPVLPAATRAASVG